MAIVYPHAIFHGLDIGISDSFSRGSKRLSHRLIVPIAPRIDLPDNVNFEIHDINEQTRFLTGSINLVHARSVSMTVSWIVFMIYLDTRFSETNPFQVRDYRTIIREAARILQPGGMFLSGEWFRYPAFDSARFPNLNLRTNAPNLTSFFERWNEALLQRRGIRPVEREINQLVSESGLFRDVVSHSMFLPIGDWREELPLKAMGRQYRDCMRRYLESSRRLMLDSGHTNQELDTMFAHANHEMRYVEGLGGIYYVVAAIRV